MSCLSARGRAHNPGTMNDILLLVLLAGLLALLRVRLG